MAPHLAPGELDVIHQKFAAGMSPILIHKWLKALREKTGVDTPHLTNLRKALKGKRYKRGRVETRVKKSDVHKAHGVAYGCQAQGAHQEVKQ